MSALAARLLHRGDERVDVLGGREPGMSGRGRPRRDELAVDHLCRADHRDALALHGGGERRVRVDVVVADADDEVVGLQRPSPRAIRCRPLAP